MKETKEVEDGQAAGTTDEGDSATAHEREEPSDESVGKRGSRRGKKPKRSFLSFTPKRPVSTFLVILAVGMVAGGLGISTHRPKHPEIQSLLDTCMKPTGVVPSRVPSPGQDEAAQEARRLVSLGADECRVAVYQFDRAEHARKSFDTWSFLSDVLIALGLALGVALIVSRTVEAANRRDLEDALDEKTRELSEAVMRGMFNRRHPEKLLDIVSQEILQREFIRDKLSLNYVFTRWRSPDGTHPERLKDRRFIAVKATINFTVRNVTANEAKEGKSAVAPICLVLPNPILDELKSSVGVEEVIVDGRKETRKKIDQVNREIRKQLKNDQLTDVMADFGSRVVQAGQTLHVQMAYTMIKELEDTELFRTLQISKGLDVVVFDDTGYDLKLRAKPVGFADMTELVSHDTTRHWQIDEILLPHQGILVWWKHKSPSLPPPDEPRTKLTEPQGCKDATEEP